MPDYKTIYDISVSLGEEAPTYPGDPAFLREKVFSLSKGDTAEVSRLSLCAHSGTHLDMPSHFFPGKASNLDLPLERFILTARVVEIKDPRSVGRAELERASLEPGEAVLLKTANSRRGLVVSGRFSEKYTFIEPEAARFLAGLGAPLVGLDYFSIDPFGAYDYPAHLILLGADILLLEGINLAEPEAGSYTLVCLPLKMPGAEASPVRAVLLR